MTTYDDVAFANGQPGITGHSCIATRTKVEASVEIAPKRDRRPEDPTGRLNVWLSAGIDALQAYRSEHRADLLQFEEIWITMDQVSPLVMAQTLWELGWLRTRGEIITPDRIVATAGLDNKYRPLLSQWLDAIADQRLVKRALVPATYYCERPLNADEVRETIERAVSSLTPTTHYPGFVEYFKNCVSQQLALLTGHANPRKLLFPAGTSRVADALYRHNPVSAMQNRIAAAVLRAVCSEWSGRNELSILEVGAGTGATTAALLPELRSDMAHYWFTDVSRFFTKRAADQFAGFSFLQYDQLDIDQDPSEQGYEPQSFDVIIAANVLHTAKYIGSALAHLRALLSASGVLIAIETTENTALQMLTLGHFDGVRHFQDHRRTTNLPFLSVEHWQSSLRAAGFAHVGAVPPRDAVSKAWPQHVLVAH